MLALTWVFALVGMSAVAYALAPDLKRRWSRVSRTHSSARRLRKNLLAEIEQFSHMSRELLDHSGCTVNKRLTPAMVHRHLAEVEKVVGLSEAILLNLVRNPKNLGDMLTLRISYFLIRDCKNTVHKVARTLKADGSEQVKGKQGKFPLNLRKNAKILSFRNSN